MGQLQALQVTAVFVVLALLGSFLRRSQLRARRRWKNALDAFARLQIDRDKSSGLARGPRGLSAARQVLASSHRM
jgi:hypothetical protein